MKPCNTKTKTRIVAAIIKYDESLKNYFYALQHKQSFAETFVEITDAQSPL